MDKVYIFTGEGARFPGGVFSAYELADSWIKKHALSGILTAYPINTGVYEWAIENDYFKIKKEHQASAAFIQGFSSASLEHYHYENGLSE